MTARHRCLITGCNPYLVDQQTAQEHKEATGHRVAKWPVRSAAGKRKARARNRNGYYDKYNTGFKSPEMRGAPFGHYGDSLATIQDNWHENS